MLHHDYSVQTFGHFERENQKQGAKKTKQVWDDAKQRKVLQMNTMGLPTLYMYFERAGETAWSGQKKKKEKKRKETVQRSRNDYLKAL